MRNEWTFLLGLGMWARSAMFFAFVFSLVVLFAFASSQTSFLQNSVNDIPLFIAHVWSWCRTAALWPWPLNHKEKYKVKLWINSHYFVCSFNKLFVCENDLGGQVDQWKKMSHSNLVTLRQVFTSKSFGDHSMVFVYDFFPGSETLMSRWGWKNKVSKGIGTWLIILQAFFTPEPAWSQFAWPFQWGRFSTIQVKVENLRHFDPN